MKKPCILLLCLMFVFAAYRDRAFAGKNCTDSARYGTAIDRVAEKYVGRSVPGACVIVSESNKIVCSKTYGYADLEKKRPMKSDSMVFEWGSISKTFTWICAMQLAEQGKLDLNKDIKRYLPEGFLKNLHYDKPVTMLNLMNHTAGFEEQLMDLRYLDGDREKPLAEVLSEHQPEQVFRPGEISAYSNWGAALAGFIVERVGGQDYKDYVNEHILTPLNMKNTSTGPFWNDVPGLLSRKSKGYSFSKGKFKREDAMHLRMYPAGTVNGSVSDLLRYAQELAKGYKKDSVLFRDPVTKKQLFKETYRSYGSDAGLSHGFWQYAGNSGILGHEGGTYGFKVQFWVEPRRERVILIMTNVMETGFCSDIMRAIAYKDNAAGTSEREPAVNSTKLEGDYLPARSPWKNVGKVQGRMKMISIRAEKDGKIRLTRPFEKKKLYYEHAKANVFICANASPEEKILAFNVKDGNVRSMSFRLAHDYVPAKVTQGRVGTIAGLAIYLTGGVVFFICLLIEIVARLRKGSKRKNKHDRCGLLVVVFGTLFGVCGIAGMIHWFSVYSVISCELTAIVVTGRICVAAGLLFGICGCAKRRNIRSGILLLLFAAQSLAAYYLGFLVSVK